MPDPIGTISIDRRYCGPARSGNGGYVCGQLANFIDGPARAKLIKPPPLETRIDVFSEDSGIVAYAGDTKIGMAEPASVDINLPAIPSEEGIRAAHETYLKGADTHPLAQCFVCGPKRKPGDALRLFTGPVPDSPVNADTWTPSEDFAGEDGLVRPEILWAALDCPTAFALRHGDTRLCLLAALTADIYRRPKPGERLIVMAWARGVEGRKNFGDGALIDENGEVIAAANALWIELTDPAMIAAVTAGA